MISLSAHTQPLSVSEQQSFPLTSGEPAELRGQLELLLPEDRHPLTRSLLDDALAYAEHYRGNTLLLEQAWDLLATVLSQAWQRGAYEPVARLATALAYPAGRRRNVAEAKRILQLGIVASRRIQDRHRFALLLNRLGGLVFMHGKYHLGHRLWYTGLYHMQEDSSSQPLWEPLYSFASVADILGNYAAAQHFLETFYQTRGVHDQDGLAVALFIRGLYARFMYNMEEASADLSACLRLLVPRLSCEPLSFARQLLLLVVQAELARAQGEYARAQQYTETALALAQAGGDRYTFATLLIDQGMFACRRGRFDEVRRLLPRMREVESQVSFPHMAQVNRLLEQQLLESSTDLDNRQPRLKLVPSYPADALSGREREVLQLVAQGLSNREVAERLVITTATVKKHLEHIFLRLDARNRTAAVARARDLQIIP